MDQPGASLLSRIRPRTVRPARSLILLLLLVGVLGGSVSAAGVSVQAVEVRLTVDGPAPPAVLRTRLQETVQAVVQRLLVGRPVEQLRPAQAQLQVTLAQVVGRVIVGYSVAEVRIDVGATAAVAVRLRPDPPLIRSVELIPLATVDAAVAPLVRRPLETEVAAETRTLFLGLPVDALDWAAPLLADNVRLAVERALPGFTAVVRARPASALQVEVEVLPRDGRVVRDIGVRFRSGSIPQLLLSPHAPAVISMAGPLRGLPVAFAEHKREDLERLVAERLRAYPPVIAYHIIARPLLSMAETTYVTVVADSLAYLGRVEAAVNIGTSAPAPELRAHLGRLTGRFEFYGEIALVPNTLSSRYDVGVRYQVTQTLDVGTSVTINTLETSPWVSYRLNPDITVRATYAIKQQSVEGSVRYRFTEFLSGELVGTSEGEYWIRVISNL